jgi:hypothetical protein
MAPTDFALAAAHGITERMKATWNPHLPRLPRVMVPIHLDVLMVRADGGTWADCALRRFEGEGDAEPTYVKPPPFANLAAPRTRGAYLHWALPDALTNGQAGTGNGVAFGATVPDSKSPQQVSFPVIPDRWVVLRLSPSSQASNRRAVRGWVIEAGGETPVVTELDKWTEPGKKAIAPVKPLTALGHGDPAWTAYFDNVENRLAFHDSLGDLRQGPIAYLVCGWYSDPADDPLGSGIRSLTEFHTRIDALGWALDAGELEESHASTKRFIAAATQAGLSTKEAFLATGKPPVAVAARPLAGQQVRPQTELVFGTSSMPAGLDGAGRPIDGHYTTHGEWWPSLTVCHGSVVAIGWPGRGYPGMPKGLVSEEAGGPPAASAVDVAIGNTITEALAASLAKTSANPHDAYALEAFMIGALDEFNEADGEARVDARLHANAFGSLPGGERTEIIDQMPPQRPSVPPHNIPKPKPGVFGAVRAPGGTVAGGIGGLASFDLGIGKSLKNVVFKNDVQVVKGRMSAALDAVGPAPQAVGAPESEGGRKQVEVRRTLPRFFVPADPVFLVQGCGRSYKHRGDGRFNEENKLVCRLTGFALTGHMSSAITGQTIVEHVTGEDLLERGAENGGIPIECEDLLREVAVLDPGSAAVIARKRGAGARAPGGAQAMAVEQTMWWATRDPRVDQAQLVALSGFAGKLPSPIAVNPPVDPWVPLHLDWRVQFIPAGDNVAAWDLGEIDFDPGQSLALPAANDTASGYIFEGRTLLTPGAAATTAASLRRSLKQAAAAGGATTLTPRTSIKAYSKLALDITSRIAAIKAVGVASGAAAGGIDRSELDHIAQTVENMDVLTGALENFHTRLRGGVEGDGISVPPPPGTAPSPFMRLRAGFLRVLRLRMVDCFGQFVDLAGSSETTAADGTRITVSSPMRVTDAVTKKVRADLVELAPRFTSPARLMLRYIDANGGDAEASEKISPVCGYLMPNHLDGDLLFFEASGESKGGVRPEPGSGVVWEDAPGQPASIGKLPARALGNASLAGIAQGLLDWGIADATPGAPGDETALSAFLRIIDSTLWAVDPFGHIGDEHLSLLIGHPVVVIRAQATLEVKEPIGVDEIATIAVPLRLGALTHWQDGLLGYFVNDDYRTLYCADAAVAGFARQIGPNQGFQQSATETANYYNDFAKDIGVDSTQGGSPVDHPYVDDSGVVFIRPNQKIALTLLVEPHTVVHATTGLLPRKEIGMRREWIAPALALLAPTFRFGPVLLDPKRIRMPVAADLHGTWTWSHRSDATTWAEEKVINAQGDARLAPDPAEGQEGWLKMTPQPPEA